MHTIELVVTVKDSPSKIVRLECVHQACDIHCTWWPAMGVFEAPVLLGGNSFLQYGLCGEVKGSRRPARGVTPVYDLLPVGILCSTPSIICC